MDSKRISAQPRARIQPVASAVLLSLAAPAWALTWSGNGSNENFSTTANWSENRAPVNGDAIFFLDTRNRHDPYNNFSSLTISRISSSNPFGFNYQPITISGNPLTPQYAGDGIANSASGTLTILMPLTLGGNAVFFAEGVPLRIEGPLDVSSYRVTAASFRTNVIITGVVSGSGGITVDPNYQPGNPWGELQLGGANTYTGTTVVGASTLRLIGHNAVPNRSAVTVDQGALFDLDGYNDAIGSLGGAGAVRAGAAHARRTRGDQGDRPASAGSTGRTAAARDDLHGRTLSAPASDSAAAGGGAAHAACASA
jgi:autotransporter-associated beta strand protein